MAFEYKKIDRKKVKETNGIDTFTKINIQKKFTVSVQCALNIYNQTTHFKQRVYIRFVLHALKRG